MSKYDVGYKIGNIEIISKRYDKEKKIYYCECKCLLCGKIKEHRQTTIRLMKGYGCFECCNKIKKENGFKHTRIYNIWKQMKHRCNPTSNDKRCKHYGKRGIKICDEWEKFINFYNWAMANGYQDNLTIDRIDVNGNYEPSNCRWVDWETQCNNKRNTIYVEYNNEKHNILELSKIIGLPKTTLKSRIKRNVKLDSQYKEKKEYYFNYNNKNYSLSELSKISGIPRKILYNRVFNLKWTIDEAINRQVINCKKDIQLYEYNGEKYNITQLANILGIGRTTLQYRIKHNLNYDGTKREE